MRWSPVSVLKHPAPPPKPYPFGPYFLPWQFLQYNSLSCSAQFVESKNLPHISTRFRHRFIYCRLNSISTNLNSPHLKHILCHLCPPAIRSSAAYTDLSHFGHLGCSTGTKGIFDVVFNGFQNKTENRCKKKLLHNNLKRCETNIGYKNSVENKKTLYLIFITTNNIKFNRRKTINFLIRNI